MTELPASEIGFDAFDRGRLLDETTEPDFDLRRQNGHGRLIALRPVSEAARTWWGENIPAVLTPKSGHVMFDRRLESALVQGIRERGFSVSVDR
jgi:hypothetical protein